MIELQEFRDAEFNIGVDMFGIQTIVVSYKPMAIVDRETGTKRSQKQIYDDFIMQFSKTITTWDLTENGVMVPLTVERLKGEGRYKEHGPVPLDILGMVFEACANDKKRRADLAMSATLAGVTTQELLEADSARMLKAAQAQQQGRLDEEKFLRGKEIQAEEAAYLQDRESKE